MSRPLSAMYTGIGKRLLAARTQTGMSLAAAAATAEDRTGQPWSAARIGSYERADRQPGVDDVYQLAQVYGVPVTTLLPPDPLAVDEPMVPASMVDRAVAQAMAAMRGAFSPLVPEQRASRAEHDLAAGVDL